MGEWRIKTILKKNNNNKLGLTKTKLYKKYFGKKQKCQNMWDTIKKNKTINMLV